MTSAPAHLRHGRRAGDVLPDLMLLLVALAAGLGAARLARTPAAAHVLLPIAACIIAGHVVVSLARHLRVPDPLPSVTGVLAVGLAAVWSLLPSATRTGLPTPTTVQVLLHLFSDAGTVIRSHPTPVPATTGVVLCLAAGAGLAAVFARTLWSWQELRPPGSRRPLVALFPTFGLFCYTALLSSDIDRLTGTVAYLATALVFLAVADRPVVTRRRPSWRSGTTAALVMAAVSVAVPAAASPALSGLRLDAIPFSHGGTPGPDGVGRGGDGDVAGVGALNLIDDMRAVLTSRSDLTMFTAASRIPTYWVVATLSSYVGDTWVPDAATRAAAGDAPQLAPTPPPELAEPTARHTFTVHLSIADLRSNLLPVPPATVSVGNANSVQVEPGIGVIQPFANPANLTYSATARLPTPLGTTPAPSIAALDASVPSLDLLPYLALPSSVPTAVVQLAHQIVARSRGPAAEATALVRFFTQGRRFRYTLTPPTVSGADPLSSFLFTTRAGFCQQFAGAYAVLARIDGLPTRLAVGFTTGSTLSRNTYTVTGADAHSWPQVYLGPAAGWVSYEPTPPSSNEALGAGVVNGTPTTTPPSGPPGLTTSTLSERQLGQGARPAAGATGLGSNARPAPPTTAAHPSWGPILLLALLTVALLVGAAVAGPGLWRRRRPRLRRRRYARTSPPGTEILARWEQAASVLARTGLGRRASETLDEHATRLVAQTRRPTSATSAFVPRAQRSPEPDPNTRRALEAYRSLAVLAARASYAPDPCTETDVAEARRLSDELRAALRQGTPVGTGVGARP